jgi:hypothetical protein
LEEHKALQEKFLKLEEHKVLQEDQEDN